MLIIKEFDTNNNYRELKNDEKLFHNALSYVLKGEKRFHVMNEGNSDFDLVYIENDQKAKSDPTFTDSDFFRSELIFPPYLQYDENDLSKINLELLEGFDEVFFEQVDEYSIVITKLILSNTNLKVNFKDSRIRLFPQLKDKVGIRSRPQTDKVIYVYKLFFPQYDPRDTYDVISLFHALFILQWVSDLPMKQLKYLEFSIRKTEGIGSVLATYSQIKQSFGEKNLKVYITAGSTRYSNEMLEKYFKIEKLPEDADESNTAQVRCFNTFVLNHFVLCHKAQINLDILQPEFVSELSEYADFLMSDRKVLGVLLRGTDYIVANFKGSFSPVSIEDSIDYIRDKITKEEYDKIFVATEDSNFLDMMLESFPGKVFTISQQRFSVSDFKDVKYISDLEKKRNTGVSYLNSVEDATINYFYAMYMLSRCESLVSNCMCNGVNIAVSFNDGKYKKTEILSEILND